MPPSRSAVAFQLTNECLIADSFAMVAGFEEVGKNDNETLHDITISKSYYLEVFEVTQLEYEKVMGTNRSRFNGSQLPVKYVSWATRFRFARSYPKFPRRKRQGDCIGCQQKQGGNSPAVLRARLHIVMETRPNCSGKMLGLVKVSEGKPILDVNFRGNGFWTYDVPSTV